MTEKLLTGTLSLNTTNQPYIMPSKHAEQDQIDAKWLGKSKFSDVRVEE